MEASVQQQLAWEARRRPGAAVAALIASLFTLAGAIGTGVVFGDAPRAGFLRSLARAVETGPLAEQSSLRIAFYEYYQDHSALILTFSLLRFLGLIALGWALTYLAIATRARRMELPRFLVYVPLIGALLSAVAALLYDVAFRASISEFLDGPRTVEAAEEASTGSVMLAAQLIGLPGALGLAMGFVLVSLNAMRAGLLTRFIGVLGIIVGVLIIFPIGSPLPIVQCFWLAAVAAVIGGVWPGGSPPAWRTGNAEPWPTAAEAREARLREIERRRGGGGGKGKARAAAPADAPERDEAAVPAGAAHPSSRKRKRKRRS